MTWYLTLRTVLTALIAKARTTNSDRQHAGGLGVRIPASSPSTTRRSPRFSRPRTRSESMPSRWQWREASLRHR
jgi:hypothetical protein